MEQALQGSGQVVSEIRRLWKATGGDNLLPASTQNEELQAYYNGTILSLLSELEELHELSQSEKASEILINKFNAKYEMMFQQLRLLTNLGSVLLPLPGGPTTH